MNEECIICFEETEQFIFLPCTHKLCAQCKDILDQKKCPICNTPFEQESLQPEPILQTRRNTIIAIETTSKCIVFILVSFVVFSVYHFLNSSEE
jgi:recombinational DNA repair protein RecR